MPTPVKWMKLRSDHCSPDREDVLDAWTQHGGSLCGMSTLEIQEHLSPWGSRQSCPVAVARMLNFVVNQLGLLEPPPNWPEGYANPGIACPVEDPLPVTQVRGVRPTQTVGLSRRVTDATARPSTPRAPVKVTRKFGKTPGTLEVNGEGFRIRNEADLVRAAQIDLDEWRIADATSRAWEGHSKNADGEVVITPLFGIKMRLERRMIAPRAWGVRYEGPSLPRKYSESAPADRTALIVPDSQHGALWADGHRKLLPMHDPIACDVVLQVAKETQPDDIVLLGDMLDLAEWSTKYPRPMAVRDTSQISLHLLHYWLAELRLACPEARIVYLEGNHENRINRLLVEKAGHVETLTAIGDDRPALDLARLLGLDALGIEYIAPYGEAVYLNDRVMLTHGDKVRSGGGATTQAVVKETRTSVAFGHVHRVSIAHRTVYGPGGDRVLTAATPGCLCDKSRTPAAAKRLDWQHGFGFVHYGPDYDHWSVHTIQSGRAFYGGRMLVGEDKHEEIGKTLDLPLAP